MHMSPLVCGVAAVLLSFPALAACPGDPSCDIGKPVVVYPPAPLIFAVPPMGYVLDPSDARPDLYIVNQGPVYDGPNVVWFAAPTYSEGGYAYAKPYPYVHSYWRRYAHRSRRYGVDRPVGYPPFGAYRYVPAASARVIEITP